MPLSSVFLSCFLLCSDVVNLAVKYVQRLVNPMIPPPLPFPQQQAASSTVAATAMPAPDKRRTSNVNGDPYCPLEWVWAIPAPAAFSCFGRIMQWYPKQVKE